MYGIIEELANAIAQMDQWFKEGTHRYALMK